MDFFDLYSSPVVHAVEPAGEEAALALVATKEEDKVNDRSDASEEEKDDGDGLSSASDQEMDSGSEAEMSEKSLLQPMRPIATPMQHGPKLHKSFLAALNKVNNPGSFAGST